ncbi:carnitine O-acetyltransferase-like [Accipiter gentilis]|uniref:carnitine O-acetyltransferase-like n=1 Tax=Astur gentilis TaxID=8957 RepID=UPI0021107917|nr:carnitine O-acetyltransferase-like [Accipiter gentilis]
MAGGGGSPQGSRVSGTGPSLAAAAVNEASLPPGGALPGGPRVPPPVTVGCLEGVEPTRCPERRGWSRGCPDAWVPAGGVGVWCGGWAWAGRDPGGPRRPGGTRESGPWGGRRGSGVAAAPSPRPPPAAPPEVPGRGGRPPLPALGATLGRLLGALEALVAPGERDRTRRLVREFGAPGGAGPRLQERLRRQPPVPPRLPEWPWGSSERLPLPVHTSAGLVLPRQDWEDWRGQLWFAARLIAGVLDYRAQLERRDPPEPWVQAAFGGCRVPGPQRDEVLRLPPGAQPPPFITVIRNCQFFQVEACGGAGTPLPPAALAAALGGLRARTGRGGAPPLGLLTGQHRHAWGRVYRLLMRDRLNRASIGRIQRSLFALSLDAPVLAAAGGRGPGGGAAQVLHGGGACANSGNRWFDKTLQFIVGEDGTCGVVYDPAVIDGAVVAEMVDHALDCCRRPEPSPTSMTSLPLPPPQRLRFSLGPETAPEVERAKRHLDSLVADVDVHCFSHEGFGVGGALRPEAIVQVALQVAFYRAHGSLCASCEPTSLRHVLPGCTDLLRPPGPPCLALARALDDPHAEPELQLALLREAVEAQSRRTQEVLAGQGAERHLQGLRQAAIAAGEPLPEIFMDPAYALATHFRLCTVQVRSREGCWLLRGPLVPDGYGVGVGHVAPSDPHDPPGPPGGLRVAVTAFACCHQTEAARLGAALQGALDSLGRLLRHHGSP